MAYRPEMFYFLLRIYVCICALLFIGKAQAYDSKFEQVIQDDIRKWDDWIEKHSASRACNEAFHIFYSKQPDAQQIVSSIEDIKSAAALCDNAGDQWGAGLIWAYTYMQISKSEKNWNTFQKDRLLSIWHASILRDNDIADPVIKANLTALLTEIALSVRQFDKTFELTHHAEAEFKRLGVDASLNLALAYTNSGSVQHALKEYSEALDYYQRSFELIENLQQSASIYAAINHRRIAHTYRAMRQEEASIKHYHGAMQIFKSNGDEASMARMSLYKGLELYELQLYDPAINSLTEAKNIFLRRGEDNDLGVALFNLGKCWYKKGNWDLAFNFYQEAERELKQVNNYEELSHVYISMGTYYENQLTKEGYEKAGLMYDIVEHIYHKHNVGTPERYGTLAINRGKLYERHNSYDDAYKEYIKAEELYRAIPSGRAKITIYKNLSYVLLKNKSYEMSAYYATKAIDKLNELLGKSFSIGNESSIALFEETSGTYEHAVLALVAQKKFSEAYNIVQQRKKKLFQLQVGMKFCQEKGMEQNALQDKRERLMKDISDIDHIALKIQSPIERAKLINQKSLKNADLDNVNILLSDDKTVYKKTCKPKDKTVKQLQDSLGKDEIIIDYNLSAEKEISSLVYHLIVFIITKENVNAINLFEDKNTEDILKQVVEYVDLIKPNSIINITKEYYKNKSLSRYDEDEYVKNVRKYAEDVRKRASLLYDVLFSKIRPQLSAVSKIYIIPDGDLNMLPFETLVDQNGELLIKNYAINYLDFNDSLIPENETTEKGLTIYGNIDYGDAENVHSERKWIKLEKSDKTILEIIKSFQKISEISHVEFIQGPEATETHFKNNKKRGNILLIWTHGAYNHFRGDEGKFTTEVIDGQQYLVFRTPEELQAREDFVWKREFNDPLSTSFLVFSGVNIGGDGSNDGYLTAREILTQDLSNIDLTILAACETGLGRISPSLGIVGMRRAFMVAGTHHLLTSLWKVNADLTGELITSFFTRYKNKQDYGYALQHAKLDLIKQLQEQNIEPVPFYWAGFVLVGR